MTDKSKLILSLLGLSAADASRVRAEMSTRFPQFRFEAGPAQHGSHPQASAEHLVFAVGPWHLSARERPSLDAMRMFGEGAAAVLAALAREVP